MKKMNIKELELRIQNTQPLTPEENDFLWDKKMGYKVEKEDKK
uniref:Uncharacterized protein n=1 Tax=viral metagenome TaxID=1070528 RepID=A0A6M3LS21_9ZZZZ